MPDMAVRTAFTATDKLSPAFKKMSGQADKFGKTASKSFKSASGGARGLGAVLGSMKGIFAGLGVAMLARQAKQAVIEYATAGDEIAKTSRQIGISAESLQELRFAADRQGLSNATLTGSLQKLNKNLGDAKAGTGALTTYLKKSNPALLQQFKNVNSNEEAMNLFIKEVNKLPNQLEKAAFAQALMGRSGQEMLKFAEAGPEGLKALRMEAQKYGLISNESAQQSEKFVDAMTNLKAAGQGLMNVVGGELIPMLTPLIQRFAEFVSQNKSLIKSELKKFFIEAAVFGKELLPLLKDTGLLIKDILKVTAALRPILRPLIQINLQFIQTLLKWNNFLINSYKAIGNAVINFINTVKMLFNEFISFLSTTWGNITQTVSSTWSNITRIVLNAWSAVKTAFNTNSIINSIKNIGMSVINFLIAPLKQALMLLSKLPGVGNIAKSALEGLDKIGGVAPQSPSPEAPNAAEVQSRYYQNTTVNVNNAQPGTSASVTPKKSATINYNMIGANP